VGLVLPYEGGHFLWSCSKQEDDNRHIQNLGRQSSVGREIKEDNEVLLEK
jgi:hypothetical protein